MSGVGFTVFQVPGSRAAKKASGSAPPARLGSGGGPMESSGGSTAPTQALSGPSITTSIIHSVAEPYQPQVQQPPPQQLASSASYSSTSSTGSNYAGRGQRNSTSGGFSAFQPQVMPHQHQVPSFQPPSSSGGAPTTFTAFGAGLNGGSAPTTTVEEARGGISWMRTGRVIRVKETGESYRFPLDEEHLPRVRASAAQYEALRERLERVAEKYVSSAATWMENPTLSAQHRSQSWKVLADKKNCVVYRQKTSDSASLTRKAIVRAKLDTTLEEIEYALYCETTSDLRAYMAHCYQESFLDAAVLQVADRAVPGGGDPLRFLGIKWLVFQSSVDSVFSCRDALVVELSKTFTDPKKGHKVLVRVTQSVDPRDLELVQEKSFGFSRTAETTVTLFRSMGPSSGKVDAAMYTDMQFEGGKATPAWLANRVVSTLFHVVTNHATCADAKFLVKSRLITDKAWVPNNERPACSVCFKSFNLLRSRHHCRVCAEIMCSPCTMELGVQASKLPVAMLPDTSGGCVVSVEKFCLKCINKARQERRSAIARAADQPFGSASLGSNGGMATSVDTDDGEAIVPASYAGRESEMYFADEANDNGNGRGSLSDMPGFYDSMPNGGNGPSTYHQSQSFASVSSNSSAGSGMSGAGVSASAGGGEKSGISYAGWSTKVLSAINREKPSESGSDASLSSLTNSTGALHLGGGGLRSANSSSNALLRSANDRRRQNSDASQTTSVSSASERGSSSVSSELRWDGRDAGRELGGEPITLVEEDPDVLDVTPLPTSFSKMEEQIAAQQALLRSMFREGQKIMQQKQTQVQYIHHGPPPQQYLERQPAASGGAIVQLDDLQHGGPPPTATSPPRAAASIEMID